jgi:inner membrane protein
MVNTLSHLGIGLLIASFAGLTGRKRAIVAFMAVLPDMDFFLDGLLTLFGGIISHELYNQLYYFMGHREFMHSLLFIFFISFALWFYSKDRIFALAGFASIFSHVYLDYATNWKMRPLYPFFQEPSIMGSMDSLDPVITLISFVPLYFLAVELLKDRDFHKQWMERRWSSILENRVKIEKGLILLLVFWCVLTPISKAILVDHISEKEGYDISYQNTYPKSFGVFLSAYQYNQTHYKLLETSYWSGIERSMYVPAVIVLENAGGDDLSTYMQYSTDIYSSSPFQEIDYPVYIISSNEDLVTVMLVDARNPFALYWTYFRTEYVFEFAKDTDEFTAYSRRFTDQRTEVNGNWFEKMAYAMIINPLFVRMK